MLFYPLSFWAQTVVVYVGGVELTSSESTPVYATTDDSGNVTTEGATADNYNIQWDGSTLTLRNATIKTSNNHTNVGGAAIGVANSSGEAALTIQLEGQKNTLSETSTGIYVYSSGGTASLTITGSGILTASGSSNGISVVSTTSNATLTIQNADVTATAEFGIGVSVQADNSYNASLTVEGGSLTASGASGRKGIHFPEGNPSLNVSGNTIVRADGGIASGTNEDEDVSTDGVGIIFNDKVGTVYGDVTLQEDLTIGEGESLDIPSGASLNTGDYTLTVNGGTLTGNVPQSGVVYKVTSVSLNKNSLTLDVGSTATLTATIKPDNASDKNVTWKSSDTNIATVDVDGKVTAVGAGIVTITATAADGSGEEATCTVTVSKATPTIQVTVPSDAVYDGKAKTATATVKDINGETLNETVAIAYYTTTDRTDANKVDNPTDAGTYYVTATFAGNDDYAEVTDKNSSFTIGKAKPTINLIVPTGEDLIYNGQAKAATATVIGVEGETLDAPTITYYMDAGMTTAAASTIDIGTYYVKAVYAESTNYESVEKIGTFTVTTANITITRPEEQEGTITLEPRSVSFTLIATISGLPEGERNGTWNWVSNEPDVARVTPITTRSKGDIISTAQVTPVSEGTATITVTYTSKNYTGTLTYAISVKAKEDPDPTPQPDPAPIYYNIYLDDVCEGVEASLSRGVVKEGNQVSVYVEVEEGYDAENLKVLFKRSLYGYWEEVEEGVQPGEYIIYNVYADIYIKVEGVEKIEEPTGMEDIEGAKVYAQDGNLNVYTSQPQEVTIITMNGAIVKRERQEGWRFYSLPKGIYIIGIGEERYKVVVR